MADMADVVDMGGMALIQMIRYSMIISLRTSKWYMLFLECLFPPVHWGYINCTFQASTIPSLLCVERYKNTNKSSCCETR